MTVKVQNKTSLICKAESEALQNARGLILDSYEAALNAVQPKKLVQSKLSRQGSTLKADGLVFDLQKFSHIYVAGGGKAGGEMAATLEQILGKWVTEGTVNVPKGGKHKTKKISLNQTSHPVPDEAGVSGTLKMMETAQKAGANDLLICLISGGGSSLMPLPREGVSLRDKQELTKVLLKSGATINEINTVRKHLSAFKGGNLAKAAYPATVLSLIISDVIGDGLEYIASGPTAPDPSTFQDAAAVLKKYNLWKDAPLTVKETLLKGINGKEPETPKPGDPLFEKVHNIIIGNNQTAIDAVKRYFGAQKVKTYVMADPLEGEAAQTAEALAKKILKVKESTVKPACIITGGETTVTVKGKGVGGRNQELALATALHLKGVDGFVFAGLSTDGVDGPTDAAGALIDSTTWTRSDKLKVNPEIMLEDNDSYTFFSRLKDLVITGPTGTNVNDLAVALLI